MRRSGVPTLALALLVLAVAGGEAGAAAAFDQMAAEERALLERYRPILRYDEDERYFAQPIDINAEPRDGDRVYGHVAREAGESWLQYWLFYSYNPQDRGILKIGRHEGDWEFLQLRLDAEGRPDLATLAQHTWAEGCEWTDLELQANGGAEAPVVYVANGSHANYSRSGTHDRPWPDPNDEADGDGRSVRPPLTVIDDESPAWVAREEPWGDSQAGWIPAEESSPPGPVFQSDGRWDRPASFHRDSARPCGSDPPGRPWLNAAMALVIGAAALAALITLRRRRRPSG